ncbi:MAG TPA: OmpA family protein [Puia sp.]|nr:OmpA family protein [Puia sp.]
MPRHCRHQILLYTLLLAALVSFSQQQRADTLILHFPFNSYRVQPADSAALSQALANHRVDSIFIDGYTDKTGSDRYNHALSRRRAVATSQLISRETIDASRWHVAGHGVARTTDRSDSENRRVEVVYYYAVTPSTAGTDTSTARPALPVQDTPLDARSRNILPDARAGDSIEVIRRDADTAIIALRHINFIVDTPIPTDSTRRILPDYVDQLRQYKDHRLEIDGYVNSIVPLRGEKDPLYILSVKRAKYVYDYLIRAGFDPAKLTYRGMGNASPVNPNPVSREEMNANMRVEIKVY